MKVLRFIIAAVLAAVMLYLARLNSEGQPEFISHSESGVTFETTTVPKALEKSETRIPITIRGLSEPDLQPVLRMTLPGREHTTQLKRYHSVPLSVEDSAAGQYYADVATTARGGRMYYYFEIRDPVGGHRASFMRPDGRPFLLKYIGHVPPAILILHVAFMTLTVFFVVFGLLHSIPLLRGSRNARPMAVAFFLAAACAFLGGYPFGFPMNYFAFDTVWEGVPFGTDATDNKTQLLFLYLLFASLSSIGSLSKGRWGRDLWSLRGLGWFGAGGFVLMLAIYSVPHSIQFSPTLTRVVCYSFISFLIVLYVAGRIRTRRSRLRAAVETS